MEEERTRFIYNGKYYTGEIKMVTPESRVEEPKVEEPKVEKTKVVVVPEIIRNKNELGVDKTTIIRLSTFDIVRVRVSPHKCATIDIVIHANNKEIEKTVLLAGEDYLKWSSDDDYLYDYVRSNIDKIYDN